MSEWLGMNEAVAGAVIGLLCLLLGLGVSQWRSAARKKQLVAAHEAQVQALQQTLTQSRQAEQRAAAALADLQQRMAQQKEQLAVALAELHHATDLQSQLTTRAEELLATKEQLQRLTDEQRHLQDEAQALQSAVSEKTATLAQAVRERATLQDQVTQLTAEAINRDEALATVQAKHADELALRQGITTAIAALYHRLQNNNASGLQDDAIGTDSDASPQMAGDSGPANNADEAWIQSPVASTQRAVAGAGAALPPAATRNDSSADVAPAISENAVDHAAKLEQFLAERGITIKHIPTEAAVDPVLNGLAGYLGEHYESVKPLYQQIKRNMQVGDDFTLILKGEPSETISRICQFGKKLYDVAFLEQYRYLRSPHYLLKAKTTRLPTAQNFFSGQWLERYVMQQVQAAVNTIRAQTDFSIDFGYITNPQIILPTGQDGELDLLFHVNEYIYWIETKSGDYQQHISKYSTMAKTLSLDEKHALMVLIDIPTSRSAELTALFRMGVCALGEFDEGLMATLKEDLL